MTGVTQGTNGTVTFNADGTVTYTPNEDYHGSDSFTYTVTTAAGNVETATVNVTVGSVDDANNDVITTDEDTAGSINVLDNDTFGENASVTGVTQGTNGTVTFNADGTVTYTPNEDYHGSDSFTYTVTTAAGNVETATVNVTVGSVDDANNDVITTDEDTAGSINVLDNDTFGENASVTGVTQGTNGTVTFNADGTVTYTPNEDYHGSDSFTYTVTTAAGNVETATVNVTVGSVDDANNDVITTDEDTAGSINVLDNDTFGENASVTGVTQGTNGTVTFNADGTVTYTPNEDYHGSDSFTYTVTTAAGNVETATVNVTVGSVDDANNDVITTDEDTAGSINVLDNDTFGENASVTGVTQGTNGTVTFNADGTVTYTPNEDYHGSDSFTYTVTTAAGNVETATVNVTVGSVDDANNDVITTDEDTAGSINVLDNDTFGENASVTGVTQGTNGTVTFNADGTVTYTPNEDYHGSDSFTYTVTTAAGNVETATVNVTVGSVDDANNDVITTDEDTAGSINVLDNDTFGENASVTGVTQGTNGTVTFNADGTVTYTPNEDYHGSDSFTYTVTTAAGNVETATVNVTVGSVDDANNDVITTDEDTAGSINVLDNDTFGENASVTGVTQGTNGTVTFNADGTVTYTPNEDYHGSDSFTYTVTTAAGNVETATVNVTVGSVDDANNDVITTDEDTAGSINVLDNDTFGENASVTGVTQGTNGTVTFNADGTVTYTPNEDYHGSDSFTYTVTTAAGNVETATVNVTVGSVDDANNDVITTDEDTAGSINVLDNDTFGENASVTGVTQGTNGTVTFNADGTVTYTPNEDYHGSDSFTYTVTTAAGNVETATVNVTVGSVDDANNDVITTDEDTAGSINVLDNDTFGENASVTGVTQGTNGTVTFNADGTVTYTPNEDYHGSDSFTYTVTTAAGNVETATVNVTVGSVDDANNDVITTDEDTAGSINVLDNDTFGENASVTGVTQGTNGTVTFNADGTVTYTPNEDYHGSDSFTYTVTTAAGNVETATVNVTVGSVDDANNDVITTDEDTAGSINVLDNDTFGENASVTGVTQGTNGTVTFNADGTVTYTPNEDYHGSDSFTYTVTTAAGNVETATVNVTVGSVDDANNDVITTDEDTAGSINILDNDTFGENASVTGVTQGTNGTVTFNADGTVTYTPNEDYHGSDSFTYTVTTAAGNVETATVNVTVGSVDDANNDVITTDEDTAGSINVLDNDTFGENASVTGVTQGTNGTVTFNADGTVTYTPNEDYHGSDSFTYTVTTAAGNVETATVNVTVGSVDDANNDVITTDEDTAGSINVLDNDTFGENASVTGVTQGTNGTVTFNADGTVTYTPNEDYHGSDSFTYTVTTAAGNVETATVNVTVGSVDDAPEADDFTETTVDCVTSVDFAPHTSDEEDDAAGVETSVIVESDPIFGTLYEVADDGTKTEVVIGQEYGDADNFEYVVDSNIAEQLSFSASDLSSLIDTSNGSTSIGYFNDLVSISAGTYTGNSPVGNDVVSNPGVYLNYDGYRVEDGFGVSTSKSGQSELDVTSKEFISVDFGNSGAEILSANLEFGSVFGNYNANSSADGEINVVALDASGNVVGTFNFNTENTSNSGNEYTLSIDGNGNSIVNVSIPDGNGGFVPFTELRVFTTQDGSANPNRNSNITFKGVDVVDAKVTETIDYKAEDSTDLESASAQVTIVTDSIVKPSPEVTSVSRDVSEDSDSVQTVSGNIEVLYADSIVLQEPSESYTSAGQNITWSSLNGGQTLIGSANGLAVITAIIDDVGNYSVTLNGPVDHLDANVPLDEMSIAIGIVASNEAGTQTGSISLTIDDDVPVAQPIINDLQPSAKAGANVQLILDVSGSMAWDSVTGQSTITNESRLSIMQDAAKQLLAEYQSLGVTQVQIVTFSGSSNAQDGASGTSWMSVTEALDLINNLTADGATYYDSAIDAAMDHWTDVGKVDGNPSNITYFLSDGAPNSGGALTDSEKSSWESFVESNDITALAYGMGEAVPISYLEDIAYNGATDSEIGAVVVPDITQLPPIILQSVVDPISGEVVNDGSNGSISGFGADGGYVSEVKYGGTTVSYDGSTVSVSGLESGVSTAIDGSEISIFIDNSHTLVLDMATGSYQFFAAVVDNDISLDFDYELSDLDGDTSNSSMTFNIQAPVLDSNDDVTSTIELVPVLIDVLANDYNPHALTSALILSSVALVNPALGQVSIVDGKVLFVPNDSASAGDIVEISYTATDKNGNSDTATMSVTMTGHSGNIISDGVGINAVYMPQGTVSSNHGDDWQNQPEPSITVNGIKVERGQQNPSLTDAADLIVTGGDNDHVEGGDFDDIIHLGDSGSNAAFDLQDATEFVELDVDDIYQGNNEDGTLESPYVAPSWADVGQGGAGNDVILGESGIDLISGGSGNDYLDGGSENDYIRAGSGNDIVIGGSGDDHLRGEDGNDILIGGLGDDILTGDDGDDLFQWVDQPFQGDVDTITDFALGEDHLDISQLLPTENNMSDLLEHIAIEKVDNGGGDKDLVITISEGANNSGQTQTIVLDNTGNQFDSVNAQGDGSVISSDLSNLVNQLFVNLPDQ
ncbi:Ig-like domain-containing protein [Vibrio lentus]|uniref:Ig-like domain-containing protein n=5 Tax=Vibrio lentus TaxID=136468 RepID=UPI0039A6EC5B